MGKDYIPTGEPVGRPSSYKPEYSEQAYKLCLLGAKDSELADFFEVTESTINNWKIEFPEFFVSIKDGKAKADAHIATKLYNRAEGARWIEEAAFKVKKKYTDERGNKVEEEEVITVPLQKAAPPDTQAIQFWLKNRKSSVWRDKQDHEITGADGGPLDVTIRYVE